MTALTERVRREWPIDDGHVADGSGKCRICGTWMPCDWSLAVSDIHVLCDKVDRLERDLHKS